MSRLVGITASAPEDWPLTTTVWMFNIAFGMLGASAFVWGKWLERAGPRKAMFVSAICFAGGFFVAAAGVSLHSLPILYAGFAAYGVGLGLGYISPVSTLIKWFPDRPGMATGMAIMGFGGGAMIGSPLAQNLMEHYKSATSPGVSATFVTMGAAYFVFMMFGVLIVRVPPARLRPERLRARARRRRSSSPRRA
jgi:MFS family permease